MFFTYSITSHSRREDGLYPNLEFTVQVFGDPIIGRRQVELFLDEARPRFLSTYEFKQLTPKPAGKYYEDESYLVRVKDIRLFFVLSCIPIKKNNVILNTTIGFLMYYHYFYYCL